MAMKDGEVFGTTQAGEAVRRFTIRGGGLTANIIGLGAIVQDLRLSGHDAPLVLGYDRFEPYETDRAFFGAVVGRFANRIGGGRFTLDGAVHQLSVNDGSNSLHGGAVGFGKRCWDVEPLGVGADGSVSLALALTSEDGDQGYPGRLRVDVRYTLTAANEWRIDYRATSDRATVVNLTNHSYFNLACGGSILDHVLTLHARRFTEIDAALIPTRIAEVAGTPFDFRMPRAIGERIRDGAEQLLRARGYDHNWILDDDGTATPLRRAARLDDPASGRVLEIETTEPGVQCYAGNQLDGRLVGSEGRTFRQSDGVCLETQHFPDSPNRPDFPSTVLRPGETFRSTTVHRFATLARDAAR
jgi:aldose 1-epimerase